jgi:hypothetical protein
MMRTKCLLFLTLLLLLAPAVHATTIVINSDDWIDVYSGMQFAFLQGHYAKFMTNKRYATILPLVVPKDQEVLVIESQRVPFTVNLAGSLQRSGYESETIYSSGGRATNIELAKLLDTSRFIIVDPSYGYNAMAVAPYALATNSYVLFGDERNTDQVLAFLRSRQVDRLILYGQLDSRLTASLASFNPEVIDKGNRYKDNLEIMSRQLAANPAVQLLLTDGSIIEEELMRAGQNGEATLLIGKGAVPDDVIRFVQNSNFKSAVLIGNHLAGSAKRLKDSTGLPVFMKFAQGITRGTESEPVRALDFFSLPIIDLNLILKKVQYNTITKNIEITYENPGIRTFVRATAGILANGDRILAVGDRDVQRIESNISASFQYPADLGEAIADQQNLSVDLFSLYGESADTLDQGIAFTGPLEIVTVRDECELSLKSLQYNERTQRFILRVENDGPVGCYVGIELRDVIIDDRPTTVSYPGILGIEKGKTESVEIKQRMSEVDLADNQEVRVRVRYGEREDVLLSLLEARLPVREATAVGISTTLLLTIIIVALIIVIIIMWLFQRRKGKHK